MAANYVERHAITTLAVVDVDVDVDGRRKGFVAGNMHKCMSFKWRGFTFCLCIHKTTEQRVYF